MFYNLLERELLYYRIFKKIQFVLQLKKVQFFWNIFMFNTGGV